MPKISENCWSGNEKYSRIPYLKSDSAGIITDNLGKATALNNFNRNQPPQYQKLIMICLATNTATSECPPKLLCNEEEVFDLLLSLETTKANGPDEILVVVFKATAHSIAKVSPFFSINQSNYIGGVYYI